jgi:hypothetical protein
VQHKENSEFWNPTCGIGGKKELLKMQKVTVGHFVVRKLESPHILCTLIFQRQNYKKKSAQITRVNTVVTLYQNTTEWLSQKINK